MSLGFTYNEVLDLEVHDFRDWVDVYEINELKKEKMMLISTYNTLLEHPEKAINSLTNKITIAFGENPFVPSKEEINKTKEIMNSGGYSF